MVVLVRDITPRSTQVSVMIKLLSHELHKKPDIVELFPDWYIEIPQSEGYLFGGS